MKNPSFVVNTTILLTTTFKVADTLTDPSTTVLTIEEPDGTEVQPTVTNVSTGLYTAAFAPDQAGYHIWKWVGTGTAAGVKEGTFYVHTSAM